MDQLCLFMWVSRTPGSSLLLGVAAAAAAKSLQSCPTLCDPIDSSPPGSPVPGILQARTLEWAAISFSKAWKWKVKVKSLSCVRLLVPAAYQAPPSTGFSRQSTGVGCHCLLWWGWLVGTIKTHSLQNQTPVTLKCSFLSESLNHPFL